MAKGYPDFEGDKSGVYLRPEWAAKEGTDKNFYGEALNVLSDVQVSMSYLVPSGKTLYMLSYSVVLYAQTRTEGDLNQMVVGTIWGSDIAEARVYIGGNGGASINFPKPLVLSAGVTVYFYLRNVSAHTAGVGLVAMGYEV